MRYTKNGNFPQKRHTIFKSPEGNFYYEQLFGTEGFHGISSLLYHIHRPTQIKEIGPSKDVSPKVAIEKNVAPRRFQGKNISPEKDFLDSKKILMFNNDLKMGLAKPQDSMGYYYKNGQCDELYFVHEGKGILKTMLGNLEFEKGDYLIIPRGTILQFELNTQETVLFFI